VLNSFFLKGRKQVKVSDCVIGELRGSVNASQLNCVRD